MAATSLISQQQQQATNKTTSKHKITTKNLIMAYESSKKMRSTAKGSGAVSITMITMTTIGLRTLPL